jgi:DNA adenine methylase
MRYLGSKRRYIKEIMPILMNHMDSSKTFVDAFGGGMNVVTNMPCKNKVALDINIYIYSLWEMLKMVKLKKQPLYLTIPREFTKEEYLDVKKNYLGEESEYNYPLSLIGYVGSALSFGGAWFNGFANYNPKKNEDHVREAYNGVKKQLDEWIHPESTDFRCCSYDQYDYSNGNNIIYSDPPYQDTKKYISDFDNKKFWDWCREQRKNGNFIYVSEYSAPDDFKEVWRKEKKDTLGSWNRNNGKTSSRIEKIFVPLDQND